MYPELKSYMEDLERSFHSITEDRKKTLNKVAGYIRSALEGDEPVRLNFICTHNSRRSHLAQIWTALAASYYELNDIETYSGGTEATAFNPRAVEAIQRAGFKVQDPGGENPEYRLSWDDDSDPLICFSKTYDDPSNPEEGFAAIMTCSDADEKCPTVTGASYRIAVTYRDPKESDGTEIEKETYDERCKQIAGEMFYMIGQV